jgi:hypothetical protein
MRDKRLTHMGCNLNFHLLWRGMRCAVPDVDWESKERVVEVLRLKRGVRPGMLLVINQL